jgi:hypothetical protein
MTSRVLQKVVKRIDGDAVQGSTVTVDADHCSASRRTLPRSMYISALKSFGVYRRTVDPAAASVG